MLELQKIKERKQFQLSSDWGELHYQNELAIYGIGRIGRRVIPTLSEQFTIPFLIDGGCKEEYVLGLRIVSIDDVIEEIRERHFKIIVTTVFATYENIARQLINYGLNENVDFCYFERFALEWNLRWNNSCVLSKIDTIITSKCTLKCTNCNMFIGYAREQRNMDINRLKKNFDAFFDVVDFVYEYTLLGGEPFLHEKLSEIITYLGDKYGKRIGRINLISNGTIVPYKNVMDAIRRYNVSICLSDYTCSVQYKEKLFAVVEILKKENIEHYIIPNNLWKDVRYPAQQYISDDPASHMRQCGHSTHSVNDGRLYWCDPAYGAECFTGYETRDDDYLDLIKLKAHYTKYESTLSIMDYLLGEMNARGCMSFCEKCAGTGRDNDKVVKAGIQMKMENQSGL